MPESLSQAFSELSNPQYRHVLLLPLLVHGLILAGLMAMVSSIFKQNRAAAFAFLLVAVCALAVRPYLDARASALSAIQAAQTSYKATEIAAIADRLSSQLWLYYGLAGLAVLGALAELTRWSAGRFLGLAAGLASIGVGIWTLDFQYRETRIYHSNLMPPARTKPATPPAPQRVEPARPPPGPTR